MRRRCIGLSFTGIGELLVLDTRSTEQVVVKIDPLTGVQTCLVDETVAASASWSFAASAVGPTPPDGGQIANDQSGNAYITSPSAGTIVKQNVATGETELLDSGPPTIFQPSGIKFASETGTLFVTDIDSSTPGLYEIAFDGDSSSCSCFPSATFGQSEGLSEETIHGIQNPKESLNMAKKKQQSTEAAVREIRQRARRKFAPEEKVRIVLEGLRGEQSISELCRREGIAANLYYRWSKDFLEAGKKQLTGYTKKLSSGCQLSSSPRPRPGKKGTPR